MNLLTRFIILQLLIFLSIHLQAQITIPTINTNSWMADVYPGIKDVKVKELKILGTHNALYLPVGGDNFCDQQGEPITTQFLNGARYFDTRIGYNGNFYAYHGDFCVQQNGADNDLNDLKLALQANPQELIILDIHQSRGDNQIIADMLFGIFDGMLIPSTLSIDLTVEEALNFGQVLIIYDTNPSNNPDAFWSQSFVNSDYVSTNDNGTLVNWLSNEINQLHYSDFPTNQFWVRQCARSFVLFTFESLKAMSNATNQLFTDNWADENLWISKCWNMLKLDWFGYHNHLQKSVERIARWYYCTNTLTTSVEINKGYYLIRSKANNLVLEVENASGANNANIQQASYNGVDNQQWLFEHLGEGKYLISAKHSEKIMTIPGDEMSNLSNVEQGELRAFSNAYWVVEQAESGYFYIRSLSSGRGLESSGNSSGDNIRINDIVGNDNQKFSIELIELETDPMIFEEASIYAFEAKHSSKVLEVEDALMTNGTTLIQSDCDDGDEQRWNLQYFGANQYIMRASHSGKVLDGMSSNSNVVQWKRNFNASQEFLITDLMNGYVSIQSQTTGQFISVQNAGMQNGDLIVLEDWSGGDQQQWKMKDVSTSSCACANNLVLSNTIDEGLYEAGISIEATGIVQGNNTIFSAGVEVSLLPEFTATPTGQTAFFEIKIEGCN